MKTVNSVENELILLKNQLLKFENIEHNYIFNNNDPEESLLAMKVNNCLSLILDLNICIEQFSRNIVSEGEIYLNLNQRYEIDGYELTSGREIEYWYESENEWRIDRIEHFNNMYGLYYSRTNNLTGLYARVR